VNGETTVTVGVPCDTGGGITIVPLANGVVVMVVVMVVVAELELFSKNVATHDVETVGVPGDARGTIRDAPVGAGEDESVLFSTKRDPPACAEGKLEVTTGGIM